MPLVALADQTQLFELFQVAADRPLILARVPAEEGLTGVGAVPVWACVVGEPDKDRDEMGGDVGCVPQRPGERFDAHDATALESWRVCVEDAGRVTCSMTDGLLQS